MAALVCRTINRDYSFYGRPCMVQGRKATFHRWADRAWVVGPSLLVGGDNGGQMWEVVAIVELDDGRVVEMPPKEITFYDNLEASHGKNQKDNCGRSSGD